MRLWIVRMWLIDAWDNLCRNVVGRLPRVFIYWAVIRCFAEVSTTPEFSHHTPDQITVFDALKKWRTPDAEEDSSPE